MTDREPPTYYFEDIEVGDEIVLGTITYTTEDIKDFARRFDPQWFHLDEEAAKDSVFGGIVASGLQTACLCNRLATNGFYAESALVGGGGLDITFPRPVRPGDDVAFAIEVVNKDVHDQHTDLGLIDFRMTGVNQDGALVIEMISHTIFKRRPC